MLAQPRVPVRPKGNQRKNAGIPVFSVRLFNHLYRGGRGSVRTDEKSGILLGMPTIPKIIGIVGSRRRDTSEDFDACCAAFDQVYRPGDKIVSGGCPQGGDQFAEAIAKHRGLTITIHYPDWNGPARKAAGFMRNTKIAEDCDILIALVHPDRTGGTEDTVKKANKLGKRVVLC